MEEIYTPEAQRVALIYVIGILVGVAFIVRSRKWASICFSKPVMASLFVGLVAAVVMAGLNIAFLNARLHLTLVSTFLVATGCFYWRLSKFRS
ncbi:hypothetical protein G6M12_24970 [Agrobacterium tumefaciens]|nr:hypothetical protein [Agrobacterium tumefaciens]